jgi:hypothetical protein
MEAYLAELTDINIARRKSTHDCAAKKLSFHGC